MKKKWLLPLLVFLFFANLKATEEGAESCFSRFLPSCSHLSLVEPCLPSDFTLGQNEKDPDFTNGYFLGTEKTLRDFFCNEEALNGCIIRAQRSEEVRQIGLDRFSSDGKVNDLTASGFTGITERKGKWGIFPYRELHATGPKGRHYFQLWVGLNEEKGETLYFQLLYPKYLSEPTQSQKKIWNDFIQKTSFLSFPDLMVLHEKEKEKNKRFHIRAEKRKSDGQIALFLKPFQEEVEVSILSCSDCDVLTGCLEGEQLHLDLQVQVGSHIADMTESLSYTLVETFSFESALLYPKNFIEAESYFLVKERLPVE